MEAGDISSLNDPVIVLARLGQPVPWLTYISIEKGNEPAAARTLIELKLPRQCQHVSFCLIGRYLALYLLGSSLHDPFRQHPL